MLRRKLNSLSFGGNMRTCLKILIQTIIGFCILSALAGAQEIKIGHVTYGNTPSEIFLTVGNVGNETLTDISVYVDGRKYQTFRGGKLLPNKAVKFFIYLQPGEHTIEVNTTEGAYDSLDIIIAKTAEQIEKEKMASTTTTTVETGMWPELAFGRREKTLLGVILIIILWFAWQKLKPRVRKSGKIKPRKKVRKRVRR